MLHMYTRPLGEQTAAGVIQTTLNGMRRRIGVYGEEGRGREGREKVRM